MRNLIPEEWIAFGLVITGAVGGFIGWLKAYEESPVEQPLSMKVFGVVRRVVMGGFVGFLIYQMSLIYDMGTAWACVLSGLLGVFSAEGLELAWHVVKTRVQAFTKTPPPDPPPK